MEKNKEKIKIRFKKGISIFFMIFISLSLYAYGCYVFIPKSKNDLGAKSFKIGTEFFAENSNSLDVMFFGDSNTRFGINPAYLKDKFNITSYSCGVNSQKISGVSFCINQALKKQNLKLVIIDTNVLDLNDKGYLQAIRKYIFAPFIFKIKTLKTKDFIGKFDLYKKNKLRGYTYTTCHYSMKNLSNYMSKNSNFKKKYIWKNTLKLELIIKKLQRKNINVILTEYPSPTVWSNSKHNRIQKIADKYNIKFLDFNTPEKSQLFDLKNEIRDYLGHLNSYGAVKLTNYMGKYIKDNYGNILNKNIKTDKILWNDSIKKLKYLDRNNHVFYPKNSK